MKCNYIEYHRLTDLFWRCTNRYTLKSVYGDFKTVSYKWWCSKHNVETWYWNTSHN